MALEKPTTIDIETLKMMMAFFAPPSSSSVSLTPNSSSKDDALMGADIGRIKDDIKEIKESLKNGEKTFALTTTLNSHVSEDIKFFSDHETRLRSLESQITRIMTWGSVVLVLLTVVQIVLHFYGK